MSKHLMMVGFLAALLGVIVGYVAGAKQGTSNADLADSFIGTAGHTKTYVAIGQLLRKGDTAGALKLSDAMVDAGASRLAAMPPQLDSDAKAQIASSLPAIQQYRQAR